MSYHLGLFSAYLISGVLITLCIQYLVILGLDRPESMIIPLCYFIGCYLAILAEPLAQTVGLPVFIHDAHTSSDENGKPCASAVSSGILSKLSISQCTLIISALDCIGSGLAVLSIKTAGGGLYQVLYSTVAVWTALLSCCLGQSLSRSQILGIIIVIIGTIAPASINTGPSIILGVVFSILTAMAHSVSYMMSNFIVSIPNHPSPLELCKTIGRNGIIVLLPYVVVYEFIFSPSGHYLILFSSRVMLALLLLISSQLAHNVLYFFIMPIIGPIFTALSQSLRSIIVSVILHVVSCGRQVGDGGSIHCLTPGKIVCIVLIFVGLSIYRLK